MFNSRSLTNKLNIFQSFVFSSLFKVFAVTETWLSNFILDSEILPCSYNIFRNDRDSRGGGVLLAVHDSIPTTAIFSPSELEIVAIKIHYRINFTLCVVYSPPCADLTYFSSLLTFLSDLSNNERVIILGDFNLPDIDWFCLSGCSSLSTLFCDFMFDNNLSQLIRQSTHNKGNILDLVLTNDLDCIGDVSVTDSLPIKSDHYLIHFFINSQPVRSAKSKSRQVIDYSKKYMQGLCDYLLDYDFTSCFSSMNVELIWSELKSIIISAIHNFAPTVKLRCRQTPKWFTSQIRHQLNCIHSIRRKAKSRPSPHYLAKLKNSESQLAEEIQSAKLSYESNLVQDFATINSNKIYKYLNSLLKHGTIPPIMHHESSEAFSSKNKASLFNQYFQSVFTTSSFILPPLNDLPCPSTVLNNILVSEVDVYDALVSLNPNKAMGVDCIGPKVLKTCAITLYFPIHHLFSLCISQHKFPEEWKIHRITPIFKSGDKSNVKKL